MFNIGDRVRSTVEVGYDDERPEYGVVLSVDGSMDDMSVGVRFMGLTTGHSLDIGLEDDGWWCFPEHLELIEPAKAMSDPLFTLEEITEWHSR